VIDPIELTFDVEYVGGFTTTRTAGLPDEPDTGGADEPDTGGADEPDTGGAPVE
jgi:hypothetical protein